MKVYDNQFTNINNINKTISLNDQPEGIYFVKIFIRDQIITQKLILIK